MRTFRVSTRQTRPRNSGGTTESLQDAERPRGVTTQSVNSQPALSQVLVKEENGVKTFYVYGLGLLGEEKDEEYRSYHFDFRGSTVALTDSTGKVVQRFQYGPYGELLKGEVSVTPFLFNGKYGVMTDANGLYYMRARFYSAEMKRFVNQDVLVGKVGEGQSLNRYAFVTGNPVSWVDPFGQYAIVAVQPSGAYGFGHAAIAIQNPNTGKLEYFNFAPDTTLEGNIISKIFNYGNVGRVKHSEMDEEEFFRVNKRSGYEDFLIIETTPEQEQNMIEFAKTLKQRFAEQQEYYRTHTNNCADFVTRVLDSQLPPAILGSYIPNTLIDDLKQSYDGEIMIKDMPWWPIFMDKQVNSWKIDDLIRVIDLWFDDE